jgi:hypothetical protein
MSSSRIGTRPSGSSVRLVSPHARKPARKLASRGTSINTKKRVTGLMARSVMMATTGFAFFDLLLLVTGGHY